MKPFFSPLSRWAQKGFSLVETALSLGILSFGFLALISMMGLGLKTARQVRDNRTSAQIAQTFTEEARQGTLSPGMLYVDLQGNACNPAQAAYTIQSTFQPIPSNPADSTSPSFLTRLILRVTPQGAPDRARTYAVIYPVPQ